MTTGPNLLDTGPLVSFSLRDSSTTPGPSSNGNDCAPLLTCEPVLTEAAFLLKREGRDADALFALLERGVVRIAISVEKEQADLRALMHRYRNRPMSFADACLFRLSEIYASGEVFTLDADFRISTRHGNKVIPVLMPE